MKEPANPDDTPIKPEGKLPAQDVPSAKTSHQRGPSSRTEDSSLIAGETFEQVGASIGEFSVEHPQSRPAASAGKSAFLVGAGILISRLVVLIRQRIFAHYFGSSGAGDAFSAAFRIPNFLQNVFGEGALSASLIPVYARLLAQGAEKEATRLANAVFGLFALFTCLV